MEIAFDIEVAGKSVCSDALDFSLYLEVPYDIVFSSIRYGLRDVQFSIETYKGHNNRLEMPLLVRAKIQ